MTQDRVSLPTGAGAVARSTDDREDDRSARPQPATTTSYQGRSDVDHAPEGRELVLAERSRRPSTATVVGAALAGAIAGGAIPFMLAGRASSPRERREETVQESIVIQRPARELYDFWRDFTNFPQFMDNIQSVDKLDEKRSRWVIKAPAGTSVEFESFIVEDVPGRLIAWRSEEGASVPNRGQVEFIETASGGGTNVRTTISYDPPAGAAGRAIAKLFGREPGVQARQDLQRLKELMENRRG